MVSRRISILILDPNLPSVQTTLSVIAIDKLARRLVDEKTGDLDWPLFQALNPDEVLLDEILVDS